MKLYGGIDLHSNNSVIALLDETDKVLYWQRLPNDLDSVLRALEPWQEAIEGVVVESTYNGYWLVDGLMEADYRLHSANTAAIKQYEGLKYADDESDARWLAHLACAWGVTGRLHLPQGKTRGERSVTQAGPVGAPENPQPAFGPEPDVPESGTWDERQSSQEPQ